MADENLKFEITPDLWILPKFKSFQAKNYLKKCGLTVRDSRDAMQQAGASATAFQMDTSLDPELDLFVSRIMYWYAACDGSAEAIEKYYIEIESVFDEILKTNAETDDEKLLQIKMIDARTYWHKANEKFDPNANIAYRLKMQSRQSVDDQIARLEMLSKLDFEPKKKGAESEDERPEGVYVVRRIGDEGSSDGKSILKRYERIIDKKLKLNGKIPTSEKMKKLKEEFPWARNVIQAIDNSFDLQRDFNGKSGRIKPLLLVGEPGTGKTSLALRIAEIMNVRSTVVAIGGSADSAALNALSRGWSSSKPCGVFLAMHSSKSADPCMILDEIEKGSAVSGQNGSAVGTLLSMLSTPHAYYDQCLLADIDMSHVTWIATANSIDRLPEALVDRFDVYTIPKPTAEHFGVILKGMKNKLAREFNTIPPFLPALDADELNALRSFFTDNRRSLRQFERMFRFVISEAQKREKAMPRMALC